MFIFNYVNASILRTISYLLIMMIDFGSKLNLRQIKGRINLRRRTKFVFTLLCTATMVAAARFSFYTLLRLMDAMLSASCLNQVEMYIVYTLLLKFHFFFWHEIKLNLMMINSLVFFFGELNRVDCVI